MIGKYRYLLQINTLYTDIRAALRGVALTQQGRSSFFAHNILVFSFIVVTYFPWLTSI